jgi:hypothetical protein
MTTETAKAPVLAPRYERFTATYPSGTVVMSFYAGGAPLEEVRVTHPPWRSMSETPAARRESTVPGAYALGPTRFQAGEGAERKSDARGEVGTRSAAAQPGLRFSRTELSAAPVLASQRPHTQQ